MMQAGILAYLTTAGCHAPAWPRDFWPALDERATKQEWDESVAAFQCDPQAILEAIREMISV